MHVCMHAYVHTQTQISNEILEGDSDLPVNRVNNPPTLYDFKGARLSYYTEITSLFTGRILIFHL